VEEQGAAWKVFKVRHDDFNVVAAEESYRPKKL